MRAYKGFLRRKDGTLWCRDFQYVSGQTYKFDGVPALCRQGFHACHERWQCWRFYPNNGDNVYYEVECGGIIVESKEGDGKLVCTEITLIREIPAPEVKYECCFYFRDGFAWVRLNDKYNFINTEGKLISEQWWDSCVNFVSGVAMVGLNGKWNHINTEGKLISEQWWDYLGYFFNDFAVVELDGKWNYIGTDGKLLSDKWFESASSFYSRFARVKLHGKLYKINKKGELKEFFA